MRKIGLSVSECIERITIVGFDPNEFYKSSAREEKSAHSIPEL